MLALLSATSACNVISRKTVDLSNTTHGDIFIVHAIRKRFHLKDFLIRATVFAQTLEICSGITPYPIIKFTSVFKPNLRPNC